MNSFVSHSFERVPGAVTRTRPVFPYPLVAHYSGSGDQNSADSFTAVRPAPPAK